MWEGTPLSIHDDLRSAADNHECLVFEKNDIGGQLFSPDGSLNIDVKIEKNNGKDWEECKRARWVDELLN